jgi:signal transduction histidine kinase
MKTILLIDDDETILSTFRLALEHHGRQVITAASGDEGIALARQHLPDLIISDINMPGTDGRSVLQALRADPQLGTKQIVLMTGNPSAVTPRTGMNLGADDFLVKPFSLEDLLRCVEARLDRADLNWRVEDRILVDLRKALSSTLPHELFTPLAGILGLTEILRTEHTRLPPTEVDAILGDLHQSSERLHRTLRNYLLLLELQSQPALPVSANWLAASGVESLVRARVQGVLDRHRRTGDGVVEIAAVPLRGESEDLAIIVEEIVDNACQYSRAGTRIEVRLRPDGVLSVSDTGRGMSAGQIERIGAFHQFGRKEHEQQGLGLGLALVRKLAARSGASVSIDSETSAGTTISVAFRVASEERAPL